MEDQLVELFSFLRDGQLAVRQLAVQHVLSFTRDGPSLAVFRKHAPRVSADLARLVEDHPTVANDAISCLINLSAADVGSERWGSLELALYLVDVILTPNALLADPAAMLLSNLAKSPLLARLVPRLVSGSSPKLAQLVDTFVKGDGKKWNEQANFDFLASLFAEIAALPEGRKFLANYPDRKNPLVCSLVPFIGHPSLIRRGGAIAAVKNCALDAANHVPMLSEDEWNSLPAILLPLAGPEQLSDEDSDGLPDELQLLELTKTREPDPALRLMLVETLICLATTREGRDIMRRRKVYPIIREAHLVEPVEAIQAEMERLVDAFMREEGEVEGAPPAS
ncbi:hypothetical protein DFJ74DRAFT_604020 [Hyaloraphidium curvatum]|nr:hypothetical protein DFJ74DRAFT_604020 [Hyaloraphidium curvatum]